MKILGFSLRDRDRACIVQAGMAVTNKAKVNQMEPITRVSERYAIFQTGGKQVQGVIGKTIAIEKIIGEPGALVEFSEVLFRKNGEGNFEFGRPYVTGAVVRASIVKHMKGPKLIIFKFKRRKKVRVKKGHRQPLTIIRVESI